MGKLEMLAQFDPVAPSHSPGGGRPLAYAVERKNRRFFKRRREESAGGMALVMVHKEQWRARISRQAPADHPAHHQLLAKPYRHRHDETAYAGRRESELRLKQSFEFQQRLVVERDEVELIWAESRFLQTVRDCVQRESRIVLLPREALFLR